MPNAKWLSPMRWRRIWFKRRPYVTFVASKMLRRMKRFSLWFQAKERRFDTISSFQNGYNKEGAYVFINFMLRPEIALKNAQYATPNKDALGSYQKKKQLDESHPSARKRWRRWRFGWQYLRVPTYYRLIATSFRSQDLRNKKVETRSRFFCAK